MIIEIKDIPQGKKIKHLSVDIDFTDSETSLENEIKPIVKTVSEKMPVPEKVVKVKKTSEKVSQTQNSEIEQKTEKLDSLPEVNITDREEKAIPEEMTNLEF
jgi:hypothetical protein